MRKEFRGGKTLSEDEMVKRFCREISGACAEGRQIPSEKRQEERREAERKREAEQNSGSEEEEPRVEVIKSIEVNRDEL